MHCGLRAAVSCLAADGAGLSCVHSYLWCVRTFVFLLRQRSQLLCTRWPLGPLLDAGAGAGAGAGGCGAANSAISFRGHRGGSPARPDDTINGSSSDAVGSFGTPAAVQGNAAEHVAHFSGGDGCKREGFQFTRAWVCVLGAWFVLARKATLQHPPIGRNAPPPPPSTTLHSIHSFTTTLYPILISTLFVSKKLLSEYRGSPSRPDPDDLYPPNGMSVPVTVSRVSNRLVHPYPCRPYQHQKLTWRRAIDSHRPSLQPLCEAHCPVNVLGVYRRVEPEPASSLVTISFT